MAKQKVLFVCIHNSARSQMAEELLRQMAAEHFDVESAGLEPGRLNPVVVAALKEDGIDITGKPTRAVADLIRKNKRYDYVVTVCDETSAERCPVFPGAVKRLHWSFTDPSKFEGTFEDKLADVRALKEDIRQHIQTWMESL